MYKQITAGNLYDFQQKITGRTNSDIFIKPLVVLEIQKMTPRDYDKLAEEINTKKLRILHEKKDGTIEQIIFDKKSDFNEQVNQI